MNTLYPGLPDYTGPNEGWALWVHHEQTLEYCTDFKKRIAYILREKPQHEQAVRLAALTCLPLDRLPPTLNQARTAFNQAWTAFNQARTAFNQAWTACDQARTACDQARTAFIQARTAFIQARTAFNQARTAYDPILRTLMAELVPAHLWRDGHLVLLDPAKEAQP